MALLPVGAALPAAAPSPVSTPRSTFGEVLRARLAQPAARAPTEPAARVLGAVEAARGRLDAVLAEARRGRTFTAGELLALQADAYRAGQTLELASKVVEQAAASVRQAVNTQV